MHDWQSPRGRTVWPLEGAGEKSVQIKDCTISINYRFRNHGNILILTVYILYQKVACVLLLVLLCINQSINNFNVTCRKCSQPMRQSSYSYRVHTQKKQYLEDMYVWCFWRCLNLQFFVPKWNICWLANQGKAREFVWEIQGNLGLNFDLCRESMALESGNTGSVKVADWGSEHLPPQ